MDSLPNFYLNPMLQMSRLDQILGKQGSKAKDVYASKISLASRVVKVERSVSFSLKRFSIKYVVFI